MIILFYLLEEAVVIYILKFNKLIVIQQFKLESFIVTVFIEHNKYF